MLITIVAGVFFAIVFLRIADSALMHLIEWFQKEPFDDKENQEQREMMARKRVDWLRKQQARRQA